MRNGGGKKDKGEEIPEPGPPSRPALPSRLMEGAQHPQRPLPPPPQNNKPATPPQRDHHDRRDHRYLPRLTTCIGMISIK